MSRSYPSNLHNSRLTISIICTTITTTINIGISTKSINTFSIEKCAIDLNNDCNNPLGWHTCMSYSDRPNGYCLLPCTNTNDCDSGIVGGFECIDGITLTGCTDCNICFQPFPSCTMDA
eukprot:105034_1